MASGSSSGTLKEVTKATKPGEVIKYMTILMDKNIEESFSMLPSLFVASAVNYEFVYSPPVQNSITFRRERVYQTMGEDMKMTTISQFEEEDQLMILLEAEQYVPKLYVQIHEGTAKAAELGELDMAHWVESIKSANPSKKLTILIYGINAYYKKIKNDSQKEFRSRVLNGQDQPEKRLRKQRKLLPEISSLEVQNALIEVQLQTKINFRFVKDVTELCIHLTQYAKAIAEAPFKKQREENRGFDWYALGDAAGSVKVDKEGKGLRALWIDQLQQFNNVGIDTAQAIAERYPSPIKLMEAYDDITTFDEGLNLLQDLTVRMGVGPLARSRRVGPEISKRMYRFFSSRDGEKFLSGSQET